MKYKMELIEIIIIIIMRSRKFYNPAYIQQNKLLSYFYWLICLGVKLIAYSQRENNSWK
jgi:hypothetical protein